MGKYRFSLTNDKQLFPQMRSYKHLCNVGIYKRVFVKLLPRNNSYVCSFFCKWNFEMYTLITYISALPSVYRQMALYGRELASMRTTELFLSIGFRAGKNVISLVSYKISGGK